MLLIHIAIEKARRDHRGALAVEVLTAGGRDARMGDLTCTLQLEVRYTRCNVDAGADLGADRL